MKKKRYICGGIFAILLLFVCNISAYADDIRASAAPTMLSVWNQNGELVGETSRPQYYCHQWDGNFANASGDTFYLKRGEKYKVQAVLSLYSIDRKLHTTERKMRMRIGANVNGMEVNFPDPITCYPTKQVNLDGITYTQYVDGCSEGEIKFDSRNITSAPGIKRYPYTGIAFQADDLMITDDMPDKGTIYIAPGEIYSILGDNWTMTDDLLQIPYSVHDPNIPITEKLPLATEFDENGINMLIVNMMKSTRAENAKYKEVDVKVTHEYSDRHLISSGKLLRGYDTYEVTYANGIIARYLEDYGITSLTVQMSADIDPVSVYLYAPPYDLFPAAMNVSSIEKQAVEYAESKGFTRVKAFDSNQLEKKRYIMQYNGLYFSTCSGNITGVDIFGLGLFYPYNIQFNNAGI